MTDELHQSTVDGRHGTPVDVAIDAVGVALGALRVVAAQPPATRTFSPRARANDARGGTRTRKPKGRAF